MIQEDEFELYRRACNEAGLGFYEQDANWRFTYVSEYLREKWRDWFRLGSIDLVGRDPREVFLDSSAGPSREELVERYHVSADHSITVEYQLTDARGQAVWLEAREQAVFASDGALVGCRGVMIDVTKRKIAEEASQAKSHFLTKVSHELRTPLNAIIGYSEIIAEDVAGTPCAHVANDLEKIGRAAQRLLGLIDDLLDFSALETDRVEVDLQLIDVSALLDELAIAATPLVLANRNTLRVVKPPVTVQLRTDRNKLKRCLLNLITNAAKFTHDGDIVLELARADGSDEIAIAVRDTGEGIELENRARIFRPFIQGEAGATRRVGGMGIGLALTQSLASRLGGRIAVESQKGVGSTFTLYLPP